MYCWLNILVLLMTAFVLQGHICDIKTLIRSYSDVVAVAADSSVCFFSYGCKLSDSRDVRRHTHTRACPQTIVSLTHPLSPSSTMSDLGHVTMSACDPHVSVKDPVSPEHHRTHRLHTSVRVCQRPSVPRTSPDTQVTHFSPSLSKTQCPPDITGHTGYTLQSESVKDPVSPEHHRTHRSHTSVRVWQRPSVPRTSPDTQVTHFSPSLTKTQCPPNITGHTGHTLQSESVKDPVSPGHHRTHRLHTSVRVCQRPSVPRTSPDTQVTHFSPSLSKTQCPPNITGHTGHTLQSESVKDPVSPEHHRTHRLHTSVRVCQRPSVPRTSPDTQVTHFSPSLSKTQCPPNITGHTGYTLQSESVKDPVSPGHHRTHRLHTSVRVWQRPSVPRTSPDTQVTHFSPSLSKTQCPPDITWHTGYTLQSKSDKDPVSPGHHRTHRSHTSVQVWQRPSVPRTSPDTQVTHFNPSLTKTQCPPNITGHTGHTLQSESDKDPVSPGHHRTHRLHTSVRVWQRPSVPRTSPDTQVTHFSPSLSKTQCPPDITGNTGYTLQSESVKDPVSPGHHRTHRLHTSVRVCQRPSVLRTSPDTQVTHFSPSLSKTQCPPDITVHTGHTLQSESVKDPVSPGHHRTHRSHTSVRVKDPVSPGHHRTHRSHTSVRVCQRPSVPRTSPDTQVTHFSPSLSKTQCPPDITGHTGYTLQSESDKDPVSPGHHRTHRLHTSVRVCQRPSVPRTSPDTQVTHFSPSQRPSVPRTSPDTQVTHFSPSLTKTQCPPDITGHTGYTLQSESVKDPVSPEHHRTHRLHTSVRVWQRPSVPRTSPDTQVTHFSPSQRPSVPRTSPDTQVTHFSPSQRPSVPRTSPDTQVTHFSPSLSKTQCPPDITGHTGYTLQSESVKDPVSPEHHRTHRLHTSVRVWQRPSVPRTSPDTQVTHFSPSLTKTQCPPDITGHTGYTLQSESDKDPVSPEHHRTHRSHTSVRVCQRPSVPRTSPDTQVTHFSPSLTKTQCPPDITGHTGYTLQSESDKDPVSPGHHRTHRLHTSVRVWQRPRVWFSCIPLKICLDLSDSSLLKTWCFLIHGEIKREIFNSDMKTKSD